MNARLRLDRFSEADVPALAAILGDPDVTKNLTADGAGPDRCVESAIARMDGYNKAWDERGYGVWAVRLIESETLLGWCGFAPPDIGEDPELQYGYSSRFWGRGYGYEAATMALDWYFDNLAYAGVSAVIFGQLNMGSAALLRKLGFRIRGGMPMENFLPDVALARDVMNYEIWRLANAQTSDVEALLFHCAFKGGQIASLGFDVLAEVEQRFCDAVLSRPGCAQRIDLESKVRAAFREGAAAPDLEWSHLKRVDWRS
ncbi:GNAT family N-acetyltransferase [Lacibacterium aquatile]|uniref:GNAT family N-acetyltransferase n=1 Tax=Lacibacterium aquatile TaxID=1168082 RepID=A0ABW5DQA6_9PROT